MSAQDVGRCGNLWPRHEAEVGPRLLLLRARLLLHLVEGRAAREHLLLLLLLLRLLLQHLLLLLHQQHLLLELLLLGV